MNGKRLLGFMVLSFYGLGFLHAERMAVYVGDSSSMLFTDFLAPAKKFGEPFMFVDVNVGDSRGNVLEEINARTSITEEALGFCPIISGRLGWVSRLYPDVFGLNLIRTGIVVTRRGSASKVAIAVSAALLDSVKSYFAGDGGACPLVVRVDGKWYLDSEVDAAARPE